MRAASVSVGSLRELRHTPPRREPLDQMCKVRRDRRITLIYKLMGLDLSALQFAIAAISSFVKPLFRGSS